MASRKSSRRSRPRRTGRMRRFMRTHTYHAAAVGGGALAAYGIVGPKQPGWSWDIDPRTTESMSDRIYNMTQAIPLYGTNPEMAAARTEVATGVAVFAASKILPKIMPSLRRLSFKVGRKSRVALLG